MRAIANLAVTPEYRANLLQARALPLIIATLRGAQLHEGGEHNFLVVAHSARALGNMCADGDVAAAVQQKAAAEGAVTVLLPLLQRSQEHLQDLRRAKLTDDRLAGLDDMLRETVRSDQRALLAGPPLQPSIDLSQVRALAKLATLKSNQRPMVESDTLHLIIEMLSAEADRDGAVSIGVKQECLDLLGQLADVPQCLSTLVSDGALRSLIVLLQLPDTRIETAAAELLAKLAQVKEYQAQISAAETLPLLVELLHASSAAAQVARRCRDPMARATPPPATDPTAPLSPHVATLSTMTPAVLSRRTPPPRCSHRHAITALAPCLAARWAACTQRAPLRQPSLPAGGAARGRR